MDPFHAVGASTIILSGYHEVFFDKFFVFAGFLEILNSYDIRIIRIIGQN